MHFNRQVSREDTASLPEDLPSEMSVVLQEEAYRGQRQFYGYSHGCKLVIETSRFNRPNPGETWKVRPRRSPNGHIVFCQAVQMMSTAEGQHPLTGFAAPHVDGKHRATLIRYGSSRWTRKGTITRAEVKEGHFHVRITGGSREARGGLDLKPADLVMDFPEDAVILDVSRSMMRLYADMSEYHLIFLSSSE